MAYFEWADDMVIDGGAIDADHRHLVELVNQLHSATTEGRGMEVVEAILKELLDYTAEHLRREEQRMAELQFPELERHRLTHQQFVADLQTLRARFEAGSISVAAQLSALLRDWLSLHIRRGDKELLRFMRGRQRA
ncbi:bacteriohemerythrin [Paucibacter soli]|uniref:bacteriohemerythrin n=1 Tax=Paucibacter soli TaxID=3133433 RepID=UPI00309B138F